MKKAFTTTELIVAIALLAIAMSICGGVFGMAIKSHRQAVAIAEISRNFRAITDQINQDFAGLIKDTPVAIIFEPDKNESPRTDSIMFFSTGDFQSSSQYDGETVKGNTSRIYYGISDATRGGDPNILIRKQKIFTQDSATFSQTNYDDPNEYELSYIDEWKNNLTDTILEDCTERPEVNLNTSSDISLIISSNVESFKVQFLDSGIVDTNDILDWYPTESGDFTGGSNRKVIINYSGVISWNKLPYSPEALKFTMTLYDSKGTLPQGKTFTHIIYIGD